MTYFLFHRDLRVYDNIGLSEALYNNNTNTNTIYPIFIFTPTQITNKNKYKSNNAIQFMIESLIDLDNQLNNKLGLYYGETMDVLNELNITKIYSNYDYTNYALKRDKAIQNKYESYFYHDVCLNEPGTITTDGGTYYKKYTPFYNKVKNNKIQQPINIRGNYKTPKKTKHSISWKELNEFYNDNPNIYSHGGRENGLKVLNSIKNYNKDDINFTTGLSPYIKFGCLSIREVYHKTKHIPDLKRQLIWRDFYYHVGYNFRNRFGLPMQEKYENIEWLDRHLSKWKKGETGYPIVDAFMRYMNETGFMHNRGRLIVASFLIKTLGCNWKYGEQYFATQLLDYDVLVNNGNWQWVASTGTDSQPYFRIFNPWLQQKKFDPNCEFIKEWIPELKDVPVKHIHRWNEFYSEYNVYLEPIVEFDKAKKEILDMYKVGL